MFKKLLLSVQRKSAFTFSSKLKTNQIKFNNNYNSPKQTEIPLKSSSSSNNILNKNQNNIQNITLSPEVELSKLYPDIKFITQPEQTNEKLEIAKNELAKSQETTNKWLQFFRGGSRILPECNRTLKNIFDYVFLEYYNDEKMSFNEKQVMFFFKNIHLFPTRLKIEKNIKEFHNFLLEFNSMNFNSKVDLQMFLECCYYLIEKHNNRTLMVVDKARNSLRTFFKIFSIEEKIFALLALSRIGCFDALLTWQLFEEDENDLISAMEKEYEISYYRIPIRCDIYLMSLLGMFIRFQDTVNAKFIDSKLMNLSMKFFEVVKFSIIILDLYENKE